MEKERIVSLISMLEISWNLKKNFKSNLQKCIATDLHSLLTNDKFINKRKKLRTEIKGAVTL